VRAWLHFRGFEPAPLELLRWQMAEKFGWTLDYIDALPLSAIHEWIQINDARAKVGK
jgi:hypothetical protein